MPRNAMSPAITTPKVATRVEKDSMGPMDVPADAMWGASTQRAVLNFPISDYRFPRSFIRAIGLIKLAFEWDQTRVVAYRRARHPLLNVAYQEVFDVFGAAVAAALARTGGRDRPRDRRLGSHFGDQAARWRAPDDRLESLHGLQRTPHDR